MVLVLATTTTQNCRDMVVTSVVISGDCFKSPREADVLSRSTKVQRCAHLSACAHGCHVSVVNKSSLAEINDLIRSPS